MNSKGKRLMPRYLLKYLESIYDGDKVIDYGRRLVSRSFINYVKSLYLMSGGKAPDDLGRRMVPEYLIKWLEDADFIEFIDDDIAYIKDVPAKALNFALLYKLGGMSYKSKNLLEMTSQTGLGYTYNAETCTLTTTTTSLFNLTTSFNIKKGSYTLYKDNTTTNLFFRYVEDGTTKNIIIPINNNHVDFELENDITITQMATYTNATSFKICLVKYEENPSYFPYNTIRNTLVTSIVSKDSNNNLIDTYYIPDEVKALEGYGYGLDDTIYNAIDFDSKTFIKLVEKRDYQEGDESDPNVITDMTYTYYPLENPVITDISQYLGDNVIKVKPEGTLIFENENKDNVPSIVSFIVPSGE